VPLVEQEMFYLHGAPDFILSF